MALEGVAVQLVVVGDGSARAEVEAEAERANARAGRRVVHLTGELADPRPAYAAADVILGMGGSALRGMAFGKPLVVQGELGFWRVCDKESVGQFLDGGWYGLGPGGEGDPCLRAELLPLLLEPDRRASLGEFSRRLVVQRFSLEHAAMVQLSVYERALELPRRIDPIEIAASLASLARYKLNRKWQRWQGSVAVDDFNVTRRA
jgi:glycosyltransferase involved in cell wall biosynthesis